MTKQLILDNFDARISKVEIKPQNIDTRIVLSSKMYDELTGEEIKVKLIFTNVGAIDFRINFFDNAIGSEACGLYQILDSTFKNKLTRSIFERRREVYLLEGDYDYNDKDPSDMLNLFDRSKHLANCFDEYNTYIQNVDAGVYIIMAKALQIVR